MRALCVSDADSYIKWGAGLLGQLPATWQREIVIVETPVTPSPQQLEAALAGSGFAPAEAHIMPLAQLRAQIAAHAPDVVILALRGPMVRVVLRAIVAAANPRPVLVSGMPGITYPATRRALVYRSQVDLLVLHSERERESYGQVARAFGIQQRFGLNSLPFLRRAETTPGNAVIFAAQAKVPAEPEQRMLVLEWLRTLALRHPERRVVIKLRAVAGEQQTHPEQHPYDELLAGLPDVPANLVVETGSMAEHLARAEALVTVSSTAALEAVALGLPVLILGDFGVDEAMINLVFEGSGLIGDADDLMNARFAHADPAWLEANYLHDPARNDWVHAVTELIADRDAGRLALRASLGSFGGPLRAAWDRKRALGRFDRSAAGVIALALGKPVHLAVRAVKQAQKVLRRPVPGSIGHRSARVD